MKHYLLIFIMASGLILSSCSKELTPEEMIFLECSEEALSLVPSSLTLEFDNNPFNFETVYKLKRVAWRDGTTSLTDRGFKQKDSSSDKRYFPLRNSNSVESSWFYTDPIYYDRPKNVTSLGLEVEFEFILEPTDAIFYEKEYLDVTNELVDDLDRGRRVFDIDETIIKTCELIDQI